MNPPPVSVGGGRVGYPGARVGREREDPPFPRADVSEVPSLPGPPEGGRNPRVALAPAGFVGFRGSGGGGGGRRGASRRRSSGKGWGTGTALEDRPEPAPSRARFPLFPLTHPARRPASQTPRRSGRPPGGAGGASLGERVGVFSRVSGDPPPGSFRPVMILPQVHLRKPCYDFYFL